MFLLRGLVKTENEVLVRFLPNSVYVRSSLNSLFFVVVVFINMCVLNVDYILITFMPERPFC